MVALSARRELGVLDMRVVLSLLIQCSDTTISGYFTIISAKIHTYDDLKACMITKYGIYKHQVMLEISELV